jgi:energy-coupling factor transport system permease protein
VLVSWKYKDRDTRYQRLDPRARLIFVFALTLALTLWQIWDLRLILLFTLVAVVQFVASGLTLRETRAVWLIMLVLAAVLTTLTLLTGNGGWGEFVDTNVIWQGPWSWLTLSSERLAFALAQFVRICTVVLLFAPVPFTIHPARYGVTFKGLGLGDKLAVATDLAFRFVPNLAHDFQTTMDAQRARGYELERAGGVLKALRNLAPLLVPVTIGSILKGEDVIDAMDLRAFGTGPRTWSQRLAYRAPDYLLLAAAAGTVLAVAALRIGLPGFGDLWVPEAFVALAG